MTSINDVLARAGAYFSERFGQSTLLQDPVANKASTIIKLMNGWARDIAGLENALDRFEAGRNPDFLTGDDLRNHAMERWLTPIENTATVIQVVATGNYGDVVPEATALYDAAGNEYTVKSDITIGTGGVGFGEACSDSGVCANPEPNSVFPADELQGISVTNGFTIEIGGAIESDSALRRRVFAQRPLWAVRGTSDAAINDLLAAGADFAKYGYVDSCAGKGFMFVVHGGEDCAICEALKYHADGTSIIGDAQCDCSDVRFQRACAVLIEVRIYTNCLDCGAIDEASIKAKVMSLSEKIARGDTVRAIELGQVDKNIERVEVKAREIPLVSCAESLTITNPFTKEPMSFGSETYSGFCAGTMACDNEWKSAVKVEFWQFPVIDINYIEVVTDACATPDKTGCTTCSD